MSFVTKRVQRIALPLAIAGATLLIGAGAAAADDWPSDGGGACRTGHFGPKHYVYPS